MTGIVRLVMVAFTLLAVALIYVSASAWRNRRRLGSFVGFLAAALFLTSSMLLGAITVGIHGYRAFTQEALAATIKTEPVGPHRFRATVTLPDSSLHMFDLAGDAVYVDAHVLKWRPIGTLLGLETEQRADRPPFQNVRVDVDGVAREIEHVQAAVGQRHRRAEPVRADRLGLDRRGECLLGERPIPMNPDRNRAEQHAGREE